MLPQVRPGTPIEEFYRQLMQGCPIIDGKFVECQFVVADGVTKSFAHGLGRPWRGAIVVGGPAGSGVLCTTNVPESSLASTTAVQIRLSAAADVFIRLWVY